MAAEQDRYGNAFSLPKSAINNAKAGLTSLTNDAKNLTTGAEQEIYGSYWSMGSDGMKRLLSKKGTVPGAEQERYGAHFGGLGPSMADKITDALTNDHLLKNAWLGHDGKQKLVHIAMKKGDGAEVDRYGQGFGLDQSTLDKGKDAIEKGWEKVTK